MHPVLRSRTTSLTVPISSPWADFTFVPTSLLLWMYVVLLLVVVLWVCAKVEAVANPKMAIMAPGKSNVFISVIGFDSM
jgi:hypothetical protein